MRMVILVLVSRFGVFCCKLVGLLVWCVSWNCCCCVLVLFVKFG